MAGAGLEFSSARLRIGSRKPRLESPHLAGGSALSFDGLASDNPAHGRIVPQTVGVVHVFIAAKASKNRVTEPTSHAVPSVLAGTAVLENIPGNLGQAEGIVKLPLGEQPGVRGDLGTVKFQLQAAVGSKRTTEGRTNQPQVRPVLSHPSDVPCQPLHQWLKLLILIIESPSRGVEYRVHLGNGD